MVDSYALAAKVQDKPETASYNTIKEVIRDYWGHVKRTGEPT